MTSTSGKTPDDTSLTDKPSFIRSLTTRTSLITTVAIAGVIVAGGAAIAANIGILSAADSSALGELSATELVAAAPESTLADTTTSTTSTTTPAVGATSDYVVDDAGMVSLLASDSGLTLVTATANDGWTPALSQSEPASLTVVFTNGGRTVVFSATLGADGSIVADVTEPMSVPGSNPTGPATIPTSPSYTGSDDDSHDDDSYEDDSYEEDDDDGSDEDEEHEYEGADDDD
jgi:hypothetical protein